jgi:DNA-binding NarL/FixJ family response regulator
MKTKVLLVDDHRLFRQGLRLLLEGSNDVQIIGEADTGRSAVVLARNLVPDLVIMDIGMPDLNGMDATRHIIAANPDVKVIALTTHSDKRYVLEILDAGAKGYVLKADAADDLLRAIRVVRNGQMYLCPAVAGAVVDSRKAPPGSEASPAPVALAPREREVLQLLSEGHSSKEIAGRLSLSPRTVEGHRRRIMGKLHLHSIADLTKFAIREGLTTLGT